MKARKRDRTVTTGRRAQNGHLSRRIDGLILPGNVASCSHPPARAFMNPQVCIPHLRTVRCSTMRKMKFSTSSPMIITENSPAKTLGISSWFLFS